VGKELALEGIYQIPAMGFSNAYLAEIAPKNMLLIDTGTSSGGAKVLEYLSKTGQSPDVISEIILTHADGDHSGSAAKLKRATGAKLAVGELDAPRVSGEMKKLKESSGIGSLLISLFSAFMRVERIKPDVVLKDGDTIGPYTILHTPGHTDGSISLYGPGQALFVGDILRTTGSGELRLPGNMMNRDPAQLRKSVERISKLEFSALMPGHGKPITENASQRLKEFVASGFKGAR
jgi:hydroxyacylglutathione hydrolase